MISVVIHLELLSAFDYAVIGGVYLSLTVISIMY